MTVRRSDVDLPLLDSLLVLDVHGRERARACQNPR
jgi:hypothetical protein